MAELVDQAMNVIQRVMAAFGAEDREQYKVIRFCDDEGIPVWHVPNSTYTTSIMVKVRNKLLGVRPGVPDLFAIPGNQLVSIEMKSLTGSATKEQREWIFRLNSAGVPSIVAKGADEAIAFLTAVKSGDVSIPEKQKAKRQVKKIPLTNDDIF